jgi:Zn-dependent protease/CBS domain-containing protein
MTGWSWKLGRVAGIDVHVHATFLILLAWVGVVHYLEHQRVADAARGIVFILALFAVIVLHELGHALTARHYGIRTRDITLLPIGGLARLERMPDDPRQELLVALAGPAVNLVLALALGAIVTPGPLTAWPDLAWVGSDFLVKLFWVNVSLAAFNLVPAFPMDGGRALRAVLAMRVDYVRATRIAAHVGQALALVFGLVGLFANPFLVVIALFVWMGAVAEANMVQARSALAGIPVSRLMITEFQTLAPTDTLRRASEHVLSGFQHDFPVRDGDRVVGLLTLGDLVKGLAQRGPDGTVAEAMRAPVELTEASELVDDAYQRLQAAGATTAPVLRDRRLVGLLTAENVAEFLMVHSLLPVAKGARA